MQRIAIMYYEDLLIQTKKHQQELPVSPYVHENDRSHLDIVTHRQLSSWPAVRESDLLPLLVQHENRSLSTGPCLKAQREV